MLVCQAHPAFTENCTGTLLLLSKIALLVSLFYWETLLQCRFDGPIVVLSFGRLRQGCCKFRASLGYRVRLPRKGNKEEKGISLAHTFIVQSAVLVTSVSCECALNPGLFLFSCVKQLWTCSVSKTFIVLWSPHSTLYAKNAMAAEGKDSHGPGHHST